MIIIGYSNYRFEDNNVFNIKTGKKISIQKHERYRLKNDKTGKYCWISLRKIQNIVGIKPTILNGYCFIPNMNYMYAINKEGTIISFVEDIRGIHMTINYNCRYPNVRLQTYKTHSVHSLMGITFLDKDYIKKGLVCMHLDNDKKNHTLSNLKIGTQSENATQCVNDGIHSNKKY